MRKSCLDYPVEIVDGVFEGESTVLADVLRKVTGQERPRVVLIADQSVVSKTEGLGSRIGRWAQGCGIEFAGNPLVVSGGERAKRYEFKTAADMLDKLLRYRVGGRDVVLAMAGGSLLDVIGWAAAQVRGGIPVVRLPTTPLSMVEAAFSTYAAIDGPGVKDAFRVPSRPAAVVIDRRFVRTVAGVGWHGGFAAAMRNAVVRDAAAVKGLVALAAKLHDRDFGAMSELISLAVATAGKKGISDFGLWGANRIESMSNFALGYSHALVFGMMLDMQYAVLKGIFKEADQIAVVEALGVNGAANGLPIRTLVAGREDYVLLGLDAWKLSSGTGFLTLPTAIGKSTVEENIDRDTMKQAVNMLK